MVAAAHLRVASCSSDQPREQRAAPGQRNLETGQSFFAYAKPDRGSSREKFFFDQHRDTYGPLWKVLQIARSGYRRQPPTSGISNCIEFGLDGRQAWQGCVHLPWGMQPLLARWVASIGNIRRTA
jgi:hypothetical protein